MHHQPGILGPLPQAARFLTFTLRHGADPRPALRRLAALCTGDSMVVGLGESLVAALGASVNGLHPFPVHTGHGFTVPATPAELWCWLRNDDRGELVHATHQVRGALADAFAAESIIDSFMYGDSRDLSGYVDGTENPTGDEAVETALVRDRGPGLDGSSFVAVQRWRHDLDAWSAKTPAEQDDTFGRRVTDNTEFDEAPASAHVKRTAQESFEPAAFVVRRSMPWADADGEGLVFIAFGASLDPFEALLRRMVGAEDGITDALFTFTRPETGAYFWCPPIRDGRLDLSAVLAVTMM
jgi:putative iron-dependent peroxidase